MKSFQKEEEDFFKLKKMGGKQDTILKHNVKAGDKNHLTNKKPILDIMSQYRIPILRLKPSKQRY